jgi:hypothetical protein
LSPNNNNPAAPTTADPLDAAAVTSLEALNGAVGKS